MIVGSRPTTSSAISSASASVDAGLKPSRRTAARSPPTMITATEVLQGVRAPVPHVERVDPVVRVAGPVQVHVPGVCRVGLLVLLDLDGVCRLRQDLFEEVDVARMVPRVERPRRRVRQDEHAALANERSSPFVEVEEVSESEAGDEHRVHDRVHVVRADVWQSHCEHVGLTLHDAPAAARRRCRLSACGRLRPRRPARKSSAAERGPIAGPGAQYAWESVPAQPTMRRRLPCPRSVHSHSRRCRNRNCSGKVFVLRVVSI